MLRTLGKMIGILTLVIGSMAIGTLFSYWQAPDDEVVSQAQMLASSATPTTMPTPTETIPPYTPLATLTPSATLKPPPTFEPPTATPTATPIPSLTPTPTTEISVVLPGLNGLETATPSTTPGCEPRDDWKLTYTVQFDDTLSSIATLYGTWVEELVDANCIADKNLIVVGQVLRVPGESQPYVPEVACVPWEVMTPINGSVTVPADGTITFNWRGPAAPKNLLRVSLPDGTLYEQLVELRQNATVNVTVSLPLEGTYTWYVYPLGNDFRQIECLEGGPWTFYKTMSSTPTPTVDPNAASVGPL